MGLHSWDHLYRPKTVPGLKDRASKGEADHRPQSCLDWCARTKRRYMACMTHSSIGCIDGPVYNYYLPISLGGGRAGRGICRPFFSKAAGFRSACMPSLSHDSQMVSFPCIIDIHAFILCLPLFSCCLPPRILHLITAAMAQGLMHWHSMAPSSIIDYGIIFLGG